MNERKPEFEKVFRALGDKHRLFILDLLMEREMNAGELLEKVSVVQSTLSHHMKALCESGLVAARKEGKWTYYTVEQEVVEAARKFLKRYLGEQETRQEKEAADVPAKETVRPGAADALTEETVRSDMADVPAKETVRPGAADTPAEETVRPSVEAEPAVSSDIDMRERKKKKAEKGRKDLDKKKNGGKKKESGRKEKERGKESPDKKEARLEGKKSEKKMKKEERKKWQKQKK